MYDNPFGEARGMMDEVMVSKFSKFRLVEKEADGVVLEGTDVRKCGDECERSLVGRIWGCKSANFSGMQTTFRKCGALRET